MRGAGCTFNDIVDVDFVVQWRVDLSYAEGVRDFLFNVQDQEATVKAVAESAMREVAGRRPLNDILNDLRFSFASLIAIWTSLFPPMALMVFGILALGGGVREAGAVVFAAAVFSAADWVFLVLRFAEDAEGDETMVQGLVDLPVRSMAKALLKRYL